MGRSSNMAKGIACGAGAGALWGLVFLAPELARDFTPLQLAVGRYCAYGLIAMALIAPRWPMIRSKITRREGFALVWLALSGNVVYYILLSSAVQKGGIAMASLVIGFLPVVVTIVGSREHGAVPLRVLAPSLLLCCAGAVCIGWQAIMAPVSGTPGEAVQGFFLAVGALISWSAYAIGNNRCLERLSDISAHDWSLLTGMMTGAQAMVLIPIAMMSSSIAHNLGAWLHFAAICAGVAVLASIMGNSLWNRACRLLPLTMVGQMVLFETLFALIYGFIWEQRLPTMLELAAFALVVMSVLSCIAVHQKHQRTR
ncbi:MAG: DMT family transporter [Sphingobium sp.]|nr:DMT family transporter [Sphingobium sp.]